MYCLLPLHVYDGYVTSPQYYVTRLAMSQFPAHSTQLQKYLRQRSQLLNFLAHRQGDSGLRKGRTSMNYVATPRLIILSKQQRSLEKEETFW